MSMADEQLHEAVIQYQKSHPDISYFEALAAVRAAVPSNPVEPSSRGAVVVPFASGRREATIDDLLRRMYALQPGARSNDANRLAALVAGTEVAAQAARLVDSGQDAELDAFTIAHARAAGRYLHNVLKSCSVTPAQYKRCIGGPFDGEAA